MEGLVVLVVIVWILFKLFKKLAARLYPNNIIPVMKRCDSSQMKDVWGHSLEEEEEYVGLYEQIQREQQQRQQAENNAGTFYNSKEWRRLRYQAFRKYGNKCCVCGRGASDGMVMHVDHIKPRSLYPHLALELSNLQIMCNECNVSKSNKDEVKWR
ncbi:HNH endonuclease [Klebsiella oxytoca]|uniref:HNH endonuclease n=2 Tax=Klebsiella oxytoca TaxID=571 RepID=UPI00157A4635|nr:HNH endonuclease [Klebsiella oxytoca]